MPPESEKGCTTAEHFQACGAVTELHLILIPLAALCPSARNLQRPAHETAKQSEDLEVERAILEAVVLVAAAGILALWPASSTTTSSASRVVPGVDDTMAASRAARALSRLLLPALGGPTIATRTPERTSSPRLHAMTSQGRHLHLVKAHPHGTPHAGSLDWSIS